MMEYHGFSSLLAADSSRVRDICVAVIGAGGKTSLLFRLGRELSRKYQKVLLTALTRMQYPVDLEPVIASEVADPDLSKLFRKGAPLFLMGSRESDAKLAGLSVAELDLARKQADICLFECDGARGLSLKAHHGNDPDVPRCATHVIIVVGADAVGTSLREGLVHRPDVFKRQWGIDDDTVIGAEFVAQVVTSSRGYVSKIPQEVEHIYFVNKQDTHPVEAEQVARAIKAVSSSRTYIGSCHTGLCRRLA
ncbi:MAG: putative selenium-dependent hydroxylase accessory protein YqeC [Fidelibacterota bacterium]|nr:MAG: putative selenium-dependent hydroxylase accessory protein YqeC [Candidatus Neomarinimicrobiota bacterium]